VPDPNHSDHESLHLRHVALTLGVQHAVSSISEFMMNSMKTPVRLSAMAGVIALLAAGAAQAQEEQGRVISSTPVMQQVAVPQDVCRDETVTVQGQKSGAGALVGGIAGGAMGNAIGKGSGRAAATIIGVIGGAIVGDRIEGDGPSRNETVRNCSTQTFYENRTVAYNVVYEYAGRQYSTQMPYDPGRTIPLNVSPVGATPPPPEVRYAPAPQVEYRAPVTTRIVVGREIIPTYPVGPGVVYVDGYRRPPGYGHRRHWRDDNDDRWYPH
jgi:uncharacterized protein YcfJ